MISVKINGRLLKANMMGGLDQKLIHLNNQCCLNLDTLITHFFAIGCISSQVIQPIVPQYNIALALKIYGDME